MSGKSHGLLLMSNIILLCMAFVMASMGAFLKHRISICMKDNRPLYYATGISVALISQLGLYGMCCRSKRLFTVYIYANALLVVFLAAVSVRNFRFMSTFGGGPRDPKEDHRKVEDFLGGMVSPQKFQAFSSCIVSHSDCNRNASQNSRVWQACCTQPSGCEYATAFGGSGPFSWKTQFKEPNNVTGACSYEFCLDCPGCKLSLLNAIVYQWRFLNSFTFPAFIFSSIAFAVSWFVLRNVNEEVEDYRGLYT